MALQGAKDADAMSRMAFEERIFDSSYCENASLFPSASRTYISRAPHDWSVGSMWICTPLAASSVQLRGAKDDPEGLAVDHDRAKLRRFDSVRDGIVLVSHVPLEPSQLLVPRIEIAPA